MKRYIVTVGDRTYYSGPDIVRARESYEKWDKKYPNKPITFESRTVLDRNKKAVELIETMRKLIDNPQPAQEDGERPMITAKQIADRLPGELLPASDSESALLSAVSLLKQDRNNAIERVKELEQALTQITERFEDKMSLHKEDCFAYQVAKGALGGEVEQ